MSELSKRVSDARPTSPVPAHLQCSSCSKPLFNACQTPHGCRLCQSCVTGLLHPVEKRRCPGNTEACRDTEEEIEVSQATCLPDMATRREVARLRVRCPNCDAGCSVQLTWAHMDQHVDSCDFLTLRCELCDLQVMKKDMQRHTSTECRQRKVSCDLCSQLVTLSEMESRHRNLESDVCCPRFSAHCPHCSDRSREMDRRAYVAHLSECPLRPNCVGNSVHNRLASSQALQHAASAATSGSRQAIDIPVRDTASINRRLTALPQATVQNHFEISPTTISDSRGLIAQSLHASGGAQQVDNPIRDSEISDNPVQMVEPPNLLQTEFGFSPGHRGPVTASCRLGNLYILATGGADGSVLLWHLSSMRLHRRLQAPSQWGAVNNLLSLPPDILLACWINRNVLMRCRCLQLSRQGPEPLNVLTDGVAELLESNSPVATICAIPGTDEAVVAFSDFSLALVSAQGGLGPLMVPSRIPIDPTVGPPLAVLIPEPGYLLILQHGNDRIYFARLRTALAGPGTVSGWQTSGHLDVLVTGAASSIQAWAAGDVPGEVVVAVVCQIRGRISIMKIDSHMQIHLVVTRFLCHAQPLTAICRLTTDLTGVQPLLATASDGGEISVWRMEGRALANQLVEVSHYKHFCTATNLHMQLSDSGQPLLIVGDAQGNEFCLGLPLLSALTGQ